MKKLELIEMSDGSRLTVGHSVKIEIKDGSIIIGSIKGCCREYLTVQCAFTSENYNNGSISIREDLIGRITSLMDSKKELLYSNDPFVGIVE